MSYSYFSSSSDVGGRESVLPKSHELASDASGFAVGAAGADDAGIDAFVAVFFAMDFACVISNRVETRKVLASSSSSSVSPSSGGHCSPRWSAQRASSSGEGMESDSKPGMGDGAPSVCRSMYDSNGWAFAERDSTKGISKDRRRNNH